MWFVGGGGLFGWGGGWGAVLGGGFGGGGTLRGGVRMAKEQAVGVGTGFVGRGGFLCGILVRAAGISFRGKKGWWICVGGR